MSLLILKLTIDFIYLHVTLNMPYGVSKWFKQRFKKINKYTFFSMITKIDNYKKKGKIFSIIITENLILLNSTDDFT